jgi:membrane protein required for colicin V production
MPFQLFDLLLAGIMLISGLLALMRGFTREVLTLVAWGLSFLAAYIVFLRRFLFDFAMQYISNEKVAMIAVCAAAFLITLIIASIIGVKIADAVSYSAVGAVDRTLGFIFGLARGLVLVTFAYLFYGWLNSERQEAWIQNAMSLPFVKSTGSFIVSFLPPDIEETLRNTALSDAPPQTLPVPGTEGPATGQQGYTNGDSKGLDNLVEGSGGSTQGTGQ